MKDDKRKKKDFLKEIEALEEKVHMLEAMQPEYKTTEKSLRESEGKYRLLFEGETDAVMIFDAETKRFEDANPATLKLLGYSKEEFLSMTVMDISHEKEKTKAHVDSIAAGKAESMSVPLRYMEKKDGTVFPVEISAGTFVSGGRKKIIGAVRDITARLEQENELRMLWQAIEQSSNIVHITDSRGITEYINPKFTEVTGYTIEEMNGKSAGELGEQSSEEKNEMWDAINAGKVWKGVFYNKRKNGDHYLEEAVISPVRDEEGNVTSYVKIAEDVTDKKRAEEEIRKERDKAQQYLDVARVTILALDVEGRVTLINRKGCEVTGYEYDEIIGKNWLEELVPERIKMEVKGVFHAMMRGETDGAEVYDNPIVTKSGGERIMSWRNNIIVDETGKRVGTISSGEDITDQRRSEEILKESEEKFRSLVERANDGICIIQDGVFQYVNDRLAAMCGLTADAMMGNPFQNYLHSSEADKVYDRYKKRMAGEDVPAQYETKFAHRDGHEVFVDVNAGMATYKGEPADFVIVHDVTDRKRTETEKQRQRDVLDKTNKDLQWKIEELEAALSHIKALEGLIPICVNCKKIHLEEKDPKDPNTWVSLEKYISEKTDASLTHGLCPDCVKKMYDEIKREKNES